MSVNTKQHLGSGEDDPVGDLGEGVRTLNGIYREKGIEDLTMILYPGDRHEVLNELDREKVYQDILSWLEERIEKEYCARGSPKLEPGSS